MQGVDPIAQSFKVRGTGFGVFVTKVDLYFKTKSSSRSITLQIRELVNGFPGPKIIPFATCTLDPEDVNISDDGSKPTVFVFPSPVYLQEEGEYCFVLIPSGNDPSYNIWVSELGQNKIGTTDRVSEQPSVGVLFTSSSSSSWTPVQTEDIKFTIYKADFSTTNTGTIIVENRNNDFLTVTPRNKKTFPGTKTTTSSGREGYPLFYYDFYDQLAYVKLAGGRIKGNVSGSGNISSFTGNANIFGNGTLFDTELYSNAAIYSANTGTRIGRVKTIISDTEAILESNGTENTSAGLYVIYDEIIERGNANAIMRVETVDSKLVTLFDTNFNFLTFFPNEFNWQYKIRQDDNDTVGSYSDFLVNESTALPYVGRIDSNTTEDISHSNTKSLSFKCEMTTTNSDVSPAFDLGKQSVIIVKNIINNDSTNEDTNGGNALAKYISKLVILDKDQDAEDLKVFLTAYKPPGTDVEIYFKPFNANDATPVYEAGYIKLDKVTSSIVVSTAGDENDFREYEYVVPAGSLTGPNGEIQYTREGNTYTGYKSFVIKIVMLSSNPAVVPLIKDYRAICLQV